MKYGLGLKLLLSFMAGGLAILYKYKLNSDSRVNHSEISSVLHIPRRFLFDTLMTPANVPAYFSWVTRLRSMDKRNITIGKVYRGIVNMPFLGQHDIIYKVTEVRDGHWVMLGPHDESYLNAQITLLLSSITDTETQFQLKIAYKRKSALFQLTLAPFLKWLTDQQLKRAVVGIRTLANSKWRKFRFPNGTEKAKPKTPQSATRFTDNTNKSDKKEL